MTPARSAYEQGRYAAHRGKPKDNRYGIGSQEWADYERGFVNEKTGTITVPTNQLRYMNTPAPYERGQQAAAAGVPKDNPFLSWTMAWQEWEAGYNYWRGVMLHATKTSPAPQQAPRCVAGEKSPREKSGARIETRQ